MKYSGKHIITNDMLINLARFGDNNIIEDKIHNKLADGIANNILVDFKSDIESTKNMSFETEYELRLCVVSYKKSQEKLNDLKFLLKELPDSTRIKIQKLFTEVLYG